MLGILFLVKKIMTKKPVSKDGLEKNSKTNIIGYKSKDPALGNLGDVGLAGSLH